MDALQDGGPPGRRQCDLLQQEPQAKEVFAALNYARRLHGSNTTYGSSQASYETLGSLLLRFNDDMLDDLWNCACKNQRGADTSSGTMMVEAHIFKRVKMSTDVKKLVLTRKRKSDKAVFTDPEWNEVKRRAQVWATQFGGIAIEALD